jgi:hypothetical protein
MKQEKYIGMDVHDATISAAVKNAQGKLLMECVTVGALPKQYSLAGQYRRFPLSGDCVFHF